ncbi:hypothetical protein CC79DRAFT_1372758 [Sarocladium strictum]
MHLFYLLICLSVSFLMVLGADPNDEIDFTSPVVADADYEPPPLPPLEPPTYQPGNLQQPYLPSPPRMDVGVDEAGNIHVRLPGEYRISLQEGVEEAVKACSGGAKIRKRDLIGCMINQAEQYAQRDNVLETFVRPQMQQLKLRLRHSMREFAGLVQRLPDMVDLNRALLFLGAAFETQTIGWKTGGLVLAGSGAVKLGQTMIFKPVKEGGEDEEPEPDPEPTEEPAPTTTSASCRPTGKDEFPTDCEEDDCKGGDDEKCTVGEEKGCPCVIYGEAVVHKYDKEFGDLQQELFKKLFEEPLETKTTEQPPAEPTTTQEAPPPPPEETAEPPEVNKPGNKEYCSKNPDCRKFTCDEEGRHPTCNYDVDFGNSWCRCDETWEE